MVKNSGFSFMRNLVPTFIILALGAKLAFGDGTNNPGLF